MPNVSFNINQVRIPLRPACVSIRKRAPANILGFPKTAQLAFFNIWASMSPHRFALGKAVSLWLQ